MGECLKLVLTEAFCQLMSNVSLLFRVLFSKNCKQANIYASCCKGPNFTYKNQNNGYRKLDNLLVKNHAD